jgi:hypothetical protein
MDSQQLSSGTTITILEKTDDMIIISYETDNIVTRRENETDNQFTSRKLFSTGRGSGTSYIPKAQYHLDIPSNIRENITEIQLIKEK